MPMRAPWEPGFAVGHALIDAQHRGLLAQCDQMAEHCLSGADAASDARFDQAFEQLRALLSFLPLNNLEDPPYLPPADDPERRQWVMATATAAGIAAAGTAVPFVSTLALPIAAAVAVGVICSLVLSIVGSLGAILCGVGIFLTLPIGMIGFYHMARQITDGGPLVITQA